MNHIANVLQSLCLKRLVLTAWMAWFCLLRCWTINLKVLISARGWTVWTCVWYVRETISRPICITDHMQTTFSWTLSILRWISSWEAGVLYQVRRNVSAGVEFALHRLVWIKTAAVHYTQRKGANSAYHRCINWRHGSAQPSYRHQHRYSQLVSHCTIASCANSYRQEQQCLC